MATGLKVWDSSGKLIFSPSSRVGISAPVIDVSVTSSPVSLSLPPVGDLYHVGISDNDSPEDAPVVTSMTRTSISFTGQHGWILCGVA